MIILYNYHINRVRGIQERNPGVSIETVKEHYFNCLIDNQQMFHFLRTKQFSVEYITDVINTVEERISKRISRALGLDWILG